MNFTGSESLNNLVPGVTLEEPANKYCKKLWKSSSYWYLLTYNVTDAREAIYQSQDLSSWSEIILPKNDGSYVYSEYQIFVTHSDIIHAVCAARSVSTPYQYKIRYGVYNGSWSWSDISISTNTPPSPYIVIDSSGYAHIVTYLYSNDHVEYANNETGSWSSWSVLAEYNPGSSKLLTGVGITQNDNIYVFISENGTDTVWHARVSGSWTYSGFSDIGIESADIEWNENYIYFAYTVANKMYMISGTGTSLNREVVDNGSGSGFFIEYFYGSIAICNDGTNIHIIYIVQDLTAYPSFYINMKYVYGTSGSFNSPIIMSNSPYTGSYPTYSAQGFYGDSYRLFYTCVGDSEQFYFALGNTDATYGEEPPEPPTPTTAGGRFFYYNSTQSQFKLARNIKYNDSGTYKIARRLLDYGSEDGWKQVRF